MEKTSQYLLAIVGIVMIVGIVTIITNSQNQNYSEEDLTGQANLAGYEPPCNWYRCSELMRQRCAQDTTGAESFTIDCCGKTWYQRC